MHLKISQSDLLQSVGFAITAAEEDVAGIATRVHTALLSAVHAGETVSAEAQADLAERVQETKTRLEDLKAIKRMAEWAGEAAELYLDTKSFVLLELNLPAR